MSQSCTWAQEGPDTGTWSTQCGNLFELNDGAPADNNMKFCCYCGKPLVGIPYTEDDEEQTP